MCVSADLILLLSLGHSTLQLSEFLCGAVENVLMVHPQCPGAFLGIIHAIEMLASLLWLPVGYHGTLPGTLLYHPSVGASP